MVWQSSPYLDMFALKKNQGRLAANRGRHQVVIIQEKQTPLSTGSLVRDGRTLGLMTMISPTWEITTSVGISTESPNPKSGALQLIPKFSHNIAPSHFVPHRRLLTSHWTVMISLTRTQATRTRLFKKGTTHPRSQPALLSWWRFGICIEMHQSWSSMMT